MSRDVKFYESVFPYHIFHSTSAEGKPSTTSESQPHIWVDDDTHNTTVNDGPQRDETGEEPGQRRSTRNHRAPAWHSNYQVSNVTVSNLSQVQMVAQTSVTPQYFCFLV